MASTITLYIFSFLYLQKLIFASGQYVNAGYWDQSTLYPPSNINATMYTHLFCGFAHLDGQTNKLVVSQLESGWFSDFVYEAEQGNPSIKTLLSIGGGSANKTAFASMVSEFGKRATFINSSINFARAYNFKGLDLDWKYPQTGFQMAKLGNLLDEWRTAINAEARNTGNPPLLLTAAFYYSPTVNGVTYPIQSIIKSLDWINVMAYDFYSPTSSNVTRAPAQLFDLSNQISGSRGIVSWIQAGVPAGKLVLGIPFYGHIWRLVDPNNHGLLAPTTGPDGTTDRPVGYNEVREILFEPTAIKVFNSTIVTNYLYSGNRWIGYDDVESVTIKVSYAKNIGLRGYFAWHVAGDFRDSLGAAALQAWGSSPSLIEEM